jgi:lipopolysaccharide export system permease protein
LKILSRYILWEYVGNLFLGILIFTFVLLLDHLFELVDLLLNKGAGIILTAKLLFLLLPSSLSLTLPMSALLATLLTFGRLSENNEITAIRASGVSAWSFLKPPLGAALLAVVFLVPFNISWAPHAQSQFRTLYLEVLQSNPLIRIEPHIFVEVGDYHLYIEKKDKKSKMMTGVTIYKTPQEGPPLRIFAQRGEAKILPGQGIVLDLKDGRIEKIDPAKPTEWFYTGFKTYRLTIPMLENQQINTRTIEEMDNKELKKQIKDHRAQQLPTAQFSCQRHLRWALAVTPLLFVLLGAPLAIRVQRGGRSIGFGISLIVVTVYYALLMGGTGVGERGLWPPWLAVWLANVIVSAVSGILLWRFVRL